MQAEFNLRFHNRTCYGDHYSVKYWTGSDWITVLDKIYMADNKREILSMIRNDIKEKLGLKRARIILREN